MILPLLAALAALEFVAIIFLLSRKAKAPTKAVIASEEFRRLRKSYLNALEQNKILKDRVSETEKCNKELQSSNGILQNQKEKLLNNKSVLENLQKKKALLFATAIHDIKNPAGAIQGLVELLNSYDLNAGEQQEIMASILEASKRLIDITQEVCVIIAKDQDDTSLNIERSSLKKIIDSVYTQNIPYAKSKSVRLLNKTSDSLPEILADPFKIEEALNNLVNNAIKFAPTDGEIIVEIIASFNSSNVIIEVRDNGVGLSQEDQELAFRKGGILSAKPTSGEESSGLGLWLVKQIVEDHGGIISLKSKLKSGCTFRIELPYIED